MKKYSTLILPAFALLTLGGCAGTSALTTTTENDGVYYTSKDKTTLTPAAQQALYAQQNADTEVAAGDVNPEYSTSNGQPVGRSSSTEYYDNNYGTYNYGSAINSYYNPYAYSNLGLGYGSAFGSPFGYGAYSPYGYGLGNSFYDPLYSPYGGLGYGSGLSLSFGLGSFYRPYGYGYYGSPYAYNDPFYGGYGAYGYGAYGLGYGGLGGYGYGGYGYGSPVYYGSNYGYGTGVSDRYRSNVRYAPRHDRSVEALSSSDRSTPRAGRMEGGVVAAPGSGNVVIDDSGNPAGTARRGRGRIVEGNMSPAQQQQNAALGLPADQPNLNTTGRRWRVVDPAQQPAATGQSGTTMQPQRRSRLFDNAAQQQAQQRVYEQPTRSFDQPSRSFERSSPSSSPSPTFSTPSSGGGRGRIR